MKVVIADQLSPQAKEILIGRGLQVVETSAQTLAKEMATADALIVRSATKATAELIAAAPNLKAIGRAGIGVDNIDLAAATQAGVVVMNTPTGNATTTAEHAIALMFALARELPQADLSTKAGKWEKSRFVGTELTGKTLGLIGCGNIGAIVAERALALKMQVKVYDPFLSDERAERLGVEKLALDALLAAADVVTLHVPLSEQTRGLIDKNALAKMKPGARLINCARGGLVVEKDLLAALDSGHLAGAALDVFEVEPAKDNPLFASDKVICTPHLGASTAEAQEKVAQQIAQAIGDYLLTGAVSHALNMPSMTAEEAKRLKPYMALCRQLGSFAGQLTRSGLKQVSIDYEGAVAGLSTRPLTQALLCGLMAPMMESVNMVNAPIVARERGIAVSETRHERDCDYQTLVKLTVTTERGPRTVSGTLFGGSKPRLVEIKGITIEAELGPYMLYITNEDKPGLIGRLGTILGEAGVNIATFHLGRTAPGADAIALIEVDGPIPEPAMAAICSLQLVKQAQLLRF